MTTGIVAVNELQAAYQAAIAGAFRPGPRNVMRQPQPPTAENLWVPASDEKVLLVSGVGGNVGASTVALAIAGQIDGPSRVVECCTVAASGLASASDAELGQDATGWVRSRRGAVGLERQSRRITGCGELPAPSSAARSATTTIIDCSWDVDALLSGSNWLTHIAQTAAAVVVVAQPTIQGLRRMGVAIELLGEQRVVAVIVGLGRRWPRAIGQALTGPLRRLRDAGRLLSMPHDPSLAITGLTPDPLPAAVQAVGASLLHQLEGLTS